ncbi:unnamed protein product [Durusdinium trenchii]|uniref:Lipoxygenase domain-containing protein n=1 Tax=Durusdinium trenchii TaxID=1381693 RepID=A0ABP0IV33_9DINO
MLCCAVLHWLSRYGPAELAQVAWAGRWPGLRVAMPVLQGGDWYYVDGEKPSPLKEPEQKAENKPGHRPISSYQLPKWVYHPERVNRRIVINKEDYFGMAADGLRNFDLWNVAHVVGNDSNAHDWIGPTSLWPCGCFVPFLAIIAYLLMVLVLLLFTTLSLIAGLFFALPLSCGCCHLYSWKCSRAWNTDVYQKLIYFFYYFQHRGIKDPKASAEFMPVEGMAPRRVLEKQYLDYGLNIQVPKGAEDQFLEQYLSPKLLENFIEDRMHWLPRHEHWNEFGPDENPVDFVMNQLSAVYPHVYQEWLDKHSDEALTRFCLYGLGAHRVEVEVVDGKKHFVVRTNALSGLPVRHGFERYGGDAYFSEDWRPVMIVDQGRGDLVEDFHQKQFIARPGDEEWERTKFRFRSSLFSLVTMVDHLYFVHLQLANLFVTSLREQMSESHPIRRFMTPFTYQTISINDNAAHNLVAPRTMGPRCFALTDKGFELAFSAAPSLQVWGYEVPKSQGGPCLHLKDYFAYKKSTGVDTEYFRQASQLYDIFCKFVTSYLECYYAKKEDLVQDQELVAMAQHYFARYEAVSAHALGRIRMPWIQAPNNDEDVCAAYDFYVNWLASLVWMVTAGHEQMGAVEVYAQDASWTAFKWTHGSACGTKQTATAQALLMSFTSTPMPKLMGEDWSHLFPKTAVLASPEKSPESAYKTFQQELATMADQCDRFNANARTRTFPECFPMYTNNPRVLESAVSV